MATELDITRPLTSKVSRDLSSKSMVFIGDVRTGKTTVASQMPLPLYLPFENGARCISGIKYLPVNRWNDYCRIVKQLVAHSKLEKSEQLYQTIIIDTVEAAGQYCENFICEKYGVTNVSEVSGRVNLWKEFRTEFWKQMNFLTSSNYTVVFICHSTTREMPNPDGTKTEKMMPKGDKEIAAMVCAESDIICYLQTNPPLEDGTEVLSSAYFKQTPFVYAGSRLKYLPNMIKEFNVENLTYAVAEAVRLEAEEKGIASISSEQQLEEFTTIRKPYGILLEEIKTKAMALNEAGRMVEYVDCIERHLGKGASVKDSTIKQWQQLELILDDLNDLI